MKRNLFSLALLLFSGSVLLASAQTLPRKPQPTGPSLIISEYGTLVDVFDADGKSLFGKLERDAFRVSYRTNGKTSSVFAVGAANVKRLQQGLQPGEVKLDGLSASVTITTTDKALQITSHFSVDAVAKELIIRRSFRNISGRHLRLLSTKQSVDPRLIFGGTSATDRRKLAQLAYGVIKAGRTKDDCRAGDCPDPPPPCFVIWCTPFGKYTPPTLKTKVTERENQITLEWRERAEVPLNEAFFITEVDLKERIR
jgi:hypothetical protein